VVPVPADVIPFELPATLVVPGAQQASAVERVVSEVLAAWWFPAEPITFAELAAQTSHLTTAEWATDWANAPANSPVLTDRTTSLQIVDIAATDITDRTAQVSVVVAQDGRARSYVLDLVDNGAGWRIAGIR